MSQSVRDTGSHKHSLFSRDLLLRAENTDGKTSLIDGSLNINSQL
jgi:hypothetical protein